MVISLTGTVDAVPVIFTKNQDSLWTTIVPPDLVNGTYIIELTATDDAGNQTHYVGKLYVWQKVITTFQMIEQPYIHKLLSEKYIVNTDENHIIKFKDHTFCIGRGDRFCLKIL